MGVSNIFESNAFCEGASLWIIKNDPTLFWWKKMDLHAKYLLSESLLKNNRPPVAELQNILDATNLKLSKLKYSRDALLLGTEDHFLNKWVLLWDNLADDQLINLIETTSVQLRAPSIRLFSDAKILPQLKSRLSTSSVTISYIENI